MKIRDLTDDQYKASLETLREALEHDAIVQEHYVVKKYCSIELGSTKDDAINISLKPKQTIQVTWRYDKDTLEPSVEGIMLSEGQPTITIKKTKTLLKWLLTNTKSTD